MGITWREAIFKARHEKNAIQRQIARRLFGSLQAVGFQLTTDHFYDPIPNTKLIERQYVDQPRACIGIDLRFAEAESTLVGWSERFHSEILGENLYSCGFQNDNAYFRNADAVALYLLIRAKQPRTVIEVGQGMSTRVIAAACKSNWTATGHKTKLITIDPHVRVTPEELKSEWLELEAINTEVQAVDQHVFESLTTNDLLFIDSSHVFKFGSDVEYEFDAIYPALRPGVLIHVHDIFTPYNYPKRWLVKRKQFWNEQYFLEQFLRFNEAFEVVLPIHLLTRESTTVRDIIQTRWASKGYVASGYSFYFKRR